jgi:hypothetical protein
MGFYALRNCTGYSNTAHGAFASERNRTGNFNTSIGMTALQFNETGNYNTAVGYGSGTNGSWDNTVSIGNYGWPNGYHNQVFLGNASTGWIGGWTTWHVYSDERFKTDVKEDVKGLDFILRLKAVTYHKNIQKAIALSKNIETPEYANKYDVEKTKISGFLAQQVEDAAQQSGYEFSGIAKPKTDTDLYSLSYESFVVPLTKAVQEQQLLINSKQTQIDDLKKQLASQQEQINRLEKLIKDLQIVSHQ